MEKRKYEIKAIIFDIGGVLELDKKPLFRKSCTNPSSKGVHEFVAKKLKLSIDQYFDSIYTNYAKSTEGTISEKKAVSSISKNLKITEKKLKKLFFKSYKKNFKTNRELYRFAFNLKKKGYKIAILSDQWHLSKKTLVPEKYEKKFDVSIISCDVGLRKPDPKIYKLILKKLKLPAKNCIFIDNREWNLEPAKKLGIKTILFKENKQVFREIKKFGIK